ncbi:BREX-1 system adenine-specific DNA-methyltransferase PglX [Proteiniclasticum ruminis]|uniref:BREX-1 system adenine-specific DNA-methyltransferase PglX n=1 Tax=Proteiniclasticum ruminis TaxID=398199 RepID=UPI0028A8DB81|nr:BREX-1 system adenine-specific DNA-methyltransferase PglX [Proteiniclasticum ruminis]
MNKTAIKNFAIWARNKLIADITYKAGLLGISEKGIKSPLPQSTQTVQFFDIGTKEPSSITGIEIQQRKKLIEEIERKAKQSDYATAYKNVIEEVAYTWFNRLIAIRFMEVNDYLPTRIRVLSSESNGKAEPDLVTHALEANLDYSAYEKDRIIQLKQENRLDELFRMLFIKQCNALNANLPELFEKTSDYTELLLNVSFTDKEGIVYHLVNDIDEDDFNVSKEGQVEIIGWLYQYYNTEPKDETFALLKKNVKITKERVPAATQLFTPDWIVRYIVENSLGRLWLEGHPNDELKVNWKYYLDENEQEEEVQKQLDKIREDHISIKPEDIKVIDPAMGSGHILVYAFDVLIQIYESYGFSLRDAAKSIVENNLYGLDIDNRAYQLAYFAIMMKARQYNRKILNDGTSCHLYAIQESNDINRAQLKYFGSRLSQMERNTALLQMDGLLDAFIDAKEYGSIIRIDNYNWHLLYAFIKDFDTNGQMSLETIGIEYTSNKLFLLVEIAKVLARKYDVVVTNPPYMGGSGMSSKLSDYVKKYFVDSKSDMFAVFIDKCEEITRNNGYYSMITQPSLLFLNSFEKIRKKIIAKNTIKNLLHMGRGIFGIDFGSTAFVIQKTKQPKHVGSYFRLHERTFQFIDPADIEIIFLEAKRHRKLSFDFSSYKTGDNNFLSLNETGNNQNNRTNIYHEIEQNNFTKIPGTPFAYWASNKFIEAFEKGGKLSDHSTIFEGLKTRDNDRFIRLWFEVSKPYWKPYAKGGAFRRWYGNNEYVLNWKDSGKEIRDFKKSSGVNFKYYNLPTITYGAISSYKFSARFLEDSFFGGGGGGITNASHLEYILGYVNSSVFHYMINAVSPTLNYEVGQIGRQPLIILESERLEIEGLVNQNIQISKSDWDSFETSRDFIRHPLIHGNVMYDAFQKWDRECQDRFVQLKDNEIKLNKIFIDIYDLHKELSSEVDDRDITVYKADLRKDIRSFLSYAVGCIFGRYSLDVAGLAYAGGQWDDSKYRSYLPDMDNIIPITDEEYFQDDMVGRFIDFVKIAYGSNKLEENLDFIAQAIGGKGNNSREIIRSYFLRDFFKDHLGTYQKRPIYWLFDSGKQNGFKALVYMHRYDENTIGNLRIDYLHRMQRIYENEITRMQDTIDNSKDTREVTAATKRKEKLIKQLQETKEYDEKIAHLALARTPIDLDDGVKVNYEKVQTDRDGKKLDVLAKI